MLLSFNMQHNSVNAYRKTTRLQRWQLGGQHQRVQRRRVQPSVAMPGPELAEAVTRAPLVSSFLALSAINVAGLALAAGVVSKLRDGADPVTVSRLRVALEGVDVAALTTRLRSMQQMTQVGPHGTWLILEECISELGSLMGSVTAAQCEVTRAASRTRGKELFGSLSKEELQRSEAHQQLEQRTLQQTDDCDSCSEDSIALSAGLPALVSSMFGSITDESRRSNVLVVTLVVMALGALDMPGQVKRRSDLRHALHALAGIGSTNLVAVEVVWSPRDTEAPRLRKDQLGELYADLQPMT